MQTAISVVVAVYNAEKTIKKCIDSILAQTFKNIEIIIVNDGSEDETLSLIKAYDDERIKIITTENRGQGLARNTGIENAEGKYIGFVDSDDTICSNMYELMIEKAEHFDAQMIECNILDVFTDRTTIQLNMPEKFLVIKDKVSYFKNYIRPCIHSFEVCNKLVKREFIVENNLYFESNARVFSEDLLFNLCSSLYLERIYFLDNPLYNYYQHKSSYSKADPLQRLYKTCSLFEIFLKKCKIDGLCDEAQCLAAYIILRYCSGAANVPGGIEAAKSVLKSETMKRYLRTYLRHSDKIKQKFFVTVFLLCPLWLQVLLVKWRY